METHGGPKASLHRRRKNVRAKCKQGNNSGSRFFNAGHLVTHKEKHNKTQNYGARSDAPNVILPDTEILVPDSLMRCMFMTELLVDFRVVPMPFSQLHCWNAANDRGMPRSQTHKCMCQMAS